jgi:3-mercaptopyruvate sulfurtransferase SseA
LAAPFLSSSWGCGGSGSGSEPAREDLAVDVSWLESRLDEGGLRILDARASSEDFEAGHVPGAGRLDPYEIASVVDGISAQLTPPEESLRVTGDWVLAQLGAPPYDDSTIQLLDARSPAEYEAGRIPTAIHRRWTINLDDGLLLPRTELEELYSDLDKTKTTVVYCLVGWRASFSWLVLESLGFEDVRVYDGSWLEWGPPSRFPIETDG